jgi:DNA polymerase III delta subunit
MIKVFAGDDRARMARAVEELAGEMGLEAERVDGADLRVGDLPSIFLGLSLFSERRLVVVRDFLENAEVAAALPDFLAAAARNEGAVVVFLEKKLDKRTGVYKKLKENAEIFEMELAKADERAVFKVFGLALEGKAEEALGVIEEVRERNEPQMFLGLISSQAGSLAGLVFSGKPSAEVAKEMGAHPFVMAQLERYRGRVSKAEMRLLIGRILETDREMKRSLTGDLWVLVKKLILQISWRQFS